MLAKNDGPRFAASVRKQEVLSDSQDATASMSKLGLVLAAFLLAQSCVATPRPDDPVAECGLERDEDWAPLTREPQGSRALVEAIRTENPSKSVPPPGTTIYLWFSTRDNKRLAFCEYQGDRTCGVSVTSVFHSRDGAWVLDDEKIVQMCTRH